MTNLDEYQKVRVVSFAFDSSNAGNKTIADVSPQVYKWLWGSSNKKPVEATQ